VADDPRFADLPRPVAAGWLPTIDNGRVRIGFAERQIVTWSVLCAGAALLAIAAAVVLTSRLLFLSAVLFSIFQLLFILRAGVELGPSTATVRWGFRARTVRWGSVTAVTVNDRGRIELSLTDEGPIEVFAPRLRWIVPDRSFAAKLAFIEAWWVDQRNAAPTTRWSTTPESARRDLSPLPHTAKPVSTVISRWSDTPAPRRAIDGPVREGDIGEPAGGGASSFPVGTLAALFVAAVVIGFLFVGRDVLVLAIALLVLFRFGRDPGRPLALAAFLLLVVSAAFTIIQDYPPQVTLAYSSRRTIAAEAGAIVGVFLVLATIIFAVTERSPDKAPRRRVWRGVEQADFQALVRVVPPWVRLLTPYVGVGFLAMLVRGAGSPGGVPPAYDRLLDNLRLGNGYSLAVPSGGIPSGVYPPLGSTIAAYFPLGPKVALILVSLGTVALVGWCAHTRWGRPASIMASLVAAVMPSLWTQQLPVQLAGLSVLGGVVLAEPKRLTPRRAGLAGLCIGFAFVARPDAGIAAGVVLLAWIVSQRGFEARGEIAGFLATMVLVVSPWLNFIWSEFGLPWPMSTLGATLNDPSTVSRVPSIIEFALGLGAVACMVPALRNLRHNARARLPFFALPVLALLLAFTNVPGRDPLSWAAPVVAVVIGPWLAWIIRTRAGATRRTVLDDIVVPEWDLELAAARDRIGVLARPVALEDPDHALIDPEPDEDHLFM
jgi:hypothetical protein